jgi:hypothetical protein
MSVEEEMPEKIRVSLGSAMVLKLLKGEISALQTAVFVHRLEKAAAELICFLGFRGLFFQRDMCLME